MMERTVVRDTLLGIEPNSGRAVQITRSLDTQADAELVIDRSILERSLSNGVLCGGCSLTVTASLIRDIEPAADDGRFGRGISAQGLRFVGETGGGRPAVVIDQSVITNNHEVGVFAVGSDVEVTHTTIADIAPTDAMELGRGLESGGQLFGDDPTVVPGTLTLRDSVIQRVEDTGILVVDSTFDGRRFIVRQVEAQAVDGAFGDGLSLIGWPEPSTLADAVIHETARASMSVFDTNLSVSGSVLSCSDIAIAVDAVTQPDAAVTNLGGNHCGCDGSWAACKALSSTLEPPQSAL
jgi:hypothetical protein